MDKSFLKWFFTVDMRDWTNYAALLLAALLFYFGIRLFIKALF